MKNVYELSEVRIGYRGVYEYTPDLNFSIGEAQLFTIVGRNGIGKSTLLRILAGQSQALTGNVMLLQRGLPMYSVKELAKTVSFVDAKPFIIRHLKVWEFVSLGRYPHMGMTGGFSHKDKEIVMRALQSVEMTDFGNRDLSELSDGQKQKVLIARVIAQDTPIVVLDEPTAFLDIPGTYEIFVLLKRLIADYNKTVIISTHDIDVALQFANVMCILFPDRAVIGTPKEHIHNDVLNQLIDSEHCYFDKKSIRVLPVEVR